MRKKYPKRRVPAQKKPLRYLRSRLYEIQEELKPKDDQISVDILSKCHIWLSDTSKSHHKKMALLGKNHPEVRVLIEKIKQEGSEILLEYNLVYGVSN